MDNLRAGLRQLYFGREAGSRAFRFALLGFDIASIIFFVVSSLMRDSAWIYVADALIAMVILADFIARLWISNNRKWFFNNLANWADIIVIITLLAPAFVGSFLFLRVLRALRLLRSYHVLSDLRDEFDFFKANEEIIQSVINLLVFIFIMTALVFVFQVRDNELITNYLDALYFTVTALTTTGFGDITLTGQTGRILSVLIMLIGVALFLRLVQTIFRPTKVRFGCPTCGLSRHDPDAVHCKHCGRNINIRTEGAEV